MSETEKLRRQVAFEATTPATRAAFAACSAVTRKLPSRRTLAEITSAWDEIERFGALCEREGVTCDLLRVAFANEIELHRQAELYRPV